MYTCLGLKKKFKIMDGVVPLSYMKPLDGKKISLLTVISVVCCGLLNVEHFGFPVRYLKPEKKSIKANQIHSLMNKENMLHHVNVNSKKGWKNFKDCFKVREDSNFPQITVKELPQIFEILHGVHSIRKARQINSYLRRKEVEENCDVKNMEEYKELLEEMVQCPKIEVKRLDSPPDGYEKLVEANILPKWPGT